MEKLDKKEKKEGVQRDGTNISYDNALKYLVEKTKSKFDSILDEEGLKHENCIDESEEFSVGYARQTLKFAESQNMPIISILSNLAKVNTYYGKVDKENILLNKSGIPVFCANDLI